MGRTTPSQKCLGSRKCQTRYPRVIGLRVIASLLGFSLVRFESRLSRGVKNVRKSIKRKRSKRIGVKSNKIRYTRKRGIRNLPFLLRICNLLKAAPCQNLLRLFVSTVLFITVACVIVLLGEYSSTQSDLVRCDIIDCCWRSREAVK